MDTPHSIEVPAAQPLLGRMLRASATLDSSSKLALVCVVFGWFFMNTLVVSLGSLEHGVRFFDMSAVIADPTRLFFAGNTPLHRFLFGMLCVACLSAPLAPYLTHAKQAWLGYLAPLALMIVCAAVLYSRTSGELFTPPADASSLSTSILHFANDLVHRGSDLVSRHVSVGAGSYLASIGAGVLTVRGVQGFRHGIIAR